MLKIIKNLYSVSMMPEVIIKRIFYSSLILQRFNKKKQTKNSITISKNKLDKEILFLQIKKMNINKGDLLIVHSSMDSLVNFDINSKELIDFLMKLIGESGTLAMPAFPVFKTDITNNRIEHLYYTRLKLCSTGILPNVFLRYQNVIRSKFPYNNLAAVGPLANDMMENNLNSDLAFGKKSSWYFCKEHEAKIIFLGVPPNKTTTMVHVAEDYLDDKWPISNWYVKRKIKIKDGSNTLLKTIRIRDQFWSRYNASYFRTKCFENEGLLKEWEYEGISFGVIANSSKLVDFIINRALRNKLFYKVPKKHYK